MTNKKIEATIASKDYNFWDKTVKQGEEMIEVLENKIMFEKKVLEMAKAELAKCDKPVKVEKEVDENAPVRSTEGN